MEELLSLLIELNYHIAFAESCTGGLCAATLIGLNNASKVIDESIVTYSNEAKIKYLGVKKATIEEFGVVSEEVVQEMALGIAKASNAQVGVGISGIAGPTGGTIDKPVGTVCFGIAINNHVYTFREVFANLSRNEVRNESVKFVFSKLIELLKKIKK